MLFDPKINQKTPTVIGKKKRCVYCGMTFSVHGNQTASNIVQIGKRLEMNAALF
jgi:hypothetical protein